jgi:uncharacterized protein (DUF1810 family)
MAYGNGSSTSKISGDRVDELAATTITIDRSAVRFVEAEQAQVERAAVQRLRAGQANISDSAIAFARFEQGTLRQTKAGIVVARSVACDEVHTAILASPVVRGDVHTWLDLRSAVAIGFGMVLGKAAIAGVRALVRRISD